MLLGFRLRNYKSFRDEQEADFGVDDARRAVRVAAVYGSNASGKTNLLQGLSFGRRAIVSSHQTWDPEGGVAGFRPFLLDGSIEPSTTLIEFEVALASARYIYGFEATADRFVREWLYVYTTNRRRTLYERELDQYDFGRTFKGPNSTIAATTRPNSLFLSAAAAGNHPGVGPLYHWFSQHLLYVSPATRDSRLRRSLELLESPEAAVRIERTLEFLRAADVGITGVKISHEPIPERQSRMMQKIVTAIQDEADGRQLPPEAIDTLMTSITTKFNFTHIGVADPVEIDIDEESFGTKALVALSGPLIDAIDTGMVLVVDELDASLHPHLVAALVSMFKSEESNPRGAQLVFSTHDASLLGHRSGEARLLDRDEVWFAEKDDDGASRLFSLAELSPRRSADFEGGYLSGRYGAVPILGRLQLAFDATIHEGSD